MAEDALVPESHETGRAPSLDKVSIADLFHAHGRRLVGALTVYTGSVGEAEELAQEAFARVYAGRNRIRDENRASSYLYSTAFNLARSRWRRGRTLLGVLDRVPPSDTAPAADARVLAEAESAITTAAVAALPTQQRACVVLHYYAELSVSDVANALHISSNSVKTHLQRALVSLRTALAEEELP